jgi:hypothetical protein
MRKFAISITAIIAAFIFFFSFSCSNEPKATTEAAKPNADSLKRVERGSYLAHHVAGCMDCHSKHEWTKFSGPMVAGTEGMGGEAFDHKLIDGIPGVVYARNITPDPETGIGNWTDEDIIKAMTRGLSKNGDTLFPLMPYAHFNAMAKEDVLSVVAFLHTLKPIKNAVPKRQLMIPASLAYPPNLKSSVDSNTIPPASNAVAYGGYIVNLCACVDCHTPMIKGQYDFAHAFSGGLTFHAPTFTVNTANITPDSATGIGAWNEERFLNKFIPYRREENYNHEAGKQNTYMPLSFYAGMQDDDLKAIYAFLRTLPPIKHVVEKYPKE